MRKIDIIGKRFGRLTVISDSGYRLTKGGTRVLRVIAKCDCGTEKEYDKRSLMRDKTRSCGCLLHDVLTKPKPLEVIDNKYLVCDKCKKTKLLNEFYKRTGLPNRWNRDRVCIECEKERSRKKRMNAKPSLVPFMTNLYHNMRSRANSKNLICDITKTDLIDMWNNQNKICALSGREMELNRKKGKWPYNCSIDRVDPAIGYTKENTHLICVHVNYMKGTMQIDEFIELCKDIGNHLPLDSI